MSAFGGEAEILCSIRALLVLTQPATWAAQDFRSAKALFIPSLKRDIVSVIACTRPPAGGVAWQPTSDGENSYSHWAAQQRGRSRRARSSRRCRWWLSQRAFARAI